MPPFEAEPDPIIEEIKAVDLATLSPIDAAIASASPIDSRIARRSAAATVTVTDVLALCGAELVSAMMRVPFAEWLGRASVDALALPASRSPPGRLLP